METEMNATQQVEALLREAGVPERGLHSGLSAFKGALLRAIADADGARTFYDGLRSELSESNRNQALIRFTQQAENLLFASDPNVTESFVEMAGDILFKDFQVPISELHFGLVGFEAGLRVGLADREEATLLAHALRAELLERLRHANPESTSLWNWLNADGSLRDGIIDGIALDYVADLVDWADAAAISMEGLYWIECTDRPELTFFLLSRTKLWDKRSELAGVAFMAGMLAGVRLSRLDRAALPVDLRQQKRELERWMAQEGNLERAGSWAEQYLNEMLEEEAVLGKPRGSLAESEATRDPRLGAFLQLAEKGLGTDANKLAMNVFKIGLLAGARAYHMFPASLGQ